LRLVVDASVAAKWFFEEEYAAQARRLLAPTEQLHAPAFMPVEMTNIAWKKVQRAQFGANLASDFPARLRDLRLTLHSDIALLDDAMAIALRFSRSVYDSLYIALALREDCPLVTADRRLFNAMQPAFPESLLWVGDLPPLDA
jgi:predicted nucleic acid-binding protein